MPDAQRPVRSARAVAASPGRNASTDSSASVTSVAVPNVVTVESSTSSASPARRRSGTASAGWRRGLRERSRQGGELIVQRGEGWIAGRRHLAREAPAVAMARSVVAFARGNPDDARLLLTLRPQDLLDADFRGACPSATSARAMIPDLPGLPRTMRGQPCRAHFRQTLAPNETGTRMGRSCPAPEPTCDHPAPILAVAG